MITGELKSKVDRIWNTMWSGRHLEPALGHRAAHLPALHQGAGRVAHAQGAQGRPDRQPDRGAGVRRPSGRAALVAFQGACAGADVRDGARRGVPLHQIDGPDRGLGRGIHLHPSHEGRSLHDAHGSGAGQRGRPARRHRHGRPRYQGRSVRVHARQDCHRRTERAVPHAAPHYQADGGHDRTHAERRHLRPGMRHCRLPRRGLRVSRRALRRPRLQERPSAPPVQRGHLPRLRLRQHHAAHRQHEHDAARRGESRHPLQGLPGSDRLRRGRRRAVFARPRQSTVQGQSPTTSQSPRICSRSSRRRRPSCCLLPCSCACFRRAVAPPSSCPTAYFSGRGRAHKTLRKILVEEQKLDAIVSMPSGVFRPYAGVSTAFLVFTKTNSGGTDDVWFYDMQADGYSLDDKRHTRNRRRGDLADILTRWQNRETERKRVRTDQSFFVPKNEIAGNDYDALDQPLQGGGIRGGESRSRRR